MTTQAQSVAVNGSQINTSGVMQVAGGGTGLSAVGTSGYVLASNGSANVYINGTGLSGYSGYSGTNGASGTSGYSGTNGTNGASGTSGYSGATGSNGSAGTSGYSGYSGSSATGVSSLNGNTGALKGMDLISTGTIGAVSSFDISSIPSGYQILKLYVIGRNTGGTTPFAGLRISQNSGSTFATSNYAWSHVYNGTGGNAGASDSYLDTGSVYGGTSIRPFWLGWGSPANQYFMTSVDMIQGAGGVPFSATFTTGTAGTGNDGPYTAADFGQYNSTTYVNGLRIIMLNGSNFGGGAWTLYGIKNA